MTKQGVAVRSLGEGPLAVWHLTVMSATSADTHHSPSKRNTARVAPEPPYAPVEICLGPMRGRHRTGVGWEKFY